MKWSASSMPRYIWICTSTCNPDGAPIAPFSMLSTGVQWPEKMMYKIAFALLAVLLLQTVALAKDPPPITDDTITDQVKIKLAGDHVVKGGGLGVNVVNGVATLTG